MYLFTYPLLYSWPGITSQNMLEYAGFPIFTGIWINYSASNRLLGYTLTISTINGGLLSAFLAIFISLVGIAFWRILSFALHQIRTRKAFQDGFHHQQQLIFRNTSSSSGAFWQMLKLPYHWKNECQERVDAHFTLGFACAHQCFRLRYCSNLIIRGHKGSWERGPYPICKWWEVGIWWLSWWRL